MYSRVSSISWRTATLVLALVSLINVGCPTPRKDPPSSPEGTAERPSPEELKAALREACEQEAFNTLLTDPGLTTAMTPVFIEGPGATQSPPAGTALDIGITEASISVDDQEICQFSFEVVPGGTGGATLVELTRTEEGLPRLVFASEDNSQGYALKVKVDGRAIEGHDLSVVDDVLSTPGAHSIRVWVSDPLGRMTYYFFSHRVTDADPSTIGRGGDPGRELVARSRVYSHDQTGGTAGTVCFLNTYLINEQPCKQPDISFLSDVEELRYQCEPDVKLSRSSSPVQVGIEDYYFEVDDDGLGKDVAGDGIRTERTYEYVIVCPPAITSKPDTDCLKACPDPVVIVQYDAYIDQLTAYAEDSTDTARISVMLQSSGIGNFQISDVIGSGYETWSQEMGVSITTSALAKTGGDVGMEYGLESGWSSTTSYNGDSIGTQKSPASNHFILTGWNVTGQRCTSTPNVMSVQVSSNLVADVDLGEQYLATVTVVGWAYNFFYDEAYVISPEARISEQKAWFRCDGASNLPQSGN